VFHIVIFRVNDTLSGGQRHPVSQHGQSIMCTILYIVPLPYMCPKIVLNWFKLLTFPQKSFEIYRPLKSENPHSTTVHVSTQMWCVY